MLEEYETNLDGLVLQDGTWNYKIPTIDTIPHQFNVEILNSEHHQRRVLSSKGMTKNFSKIEVLKYCLQFCFSPYNACILCLKVETWNFVSLTI